MVKYLNAELYKVTHWRAYTLGSLAFITGGIILVQIFLRAVGGSGNNFGSMVRGLCLMLVVGLYLALMVSDLVFSDQYKLNTLKNEVSYGLPRTRLYLGKLAAAAITALVMCAVVIAVYLLGAWVLFPVNGGTVAESFRILGETLLGALPLWFGALGFAFMLLFVTKGSTVAAVLFVIAMGPLDSVLMLGQLLLMENEGLVNALQTIRECLLGNGFDTLTNSGAMDIPRAWMVGMAWLVVSTVIGLISFQKREIN